MYDEAFKLEDCQTFRTNFQDAADAYDSTLFSSAGFISDDSVGGKHIRHQRAFRKLEWTPKSAR